MMLGWGDILNPWELLVAGLAGCVTGFIASIPVGPINVTILNEGALRGFRWALLIGAGAVAMEVVYCGLAFAGFSTLFESNAVRLAMEFVSFLLMLFLGLRYTFATTMPATTPSVSEIEHRLHPHTAFMTGFVRVLGNPAVLVFWITISATLISHEWMDDNWLSKTVCALGAGVGGFGWFAFFSFLVSRKHGKLSSKSLLRMSQASGVCLFVAALFLAAKLARQLASAR